MNFKFEIPEGIKANVFLVLEDGKGTERSNELMEKKVFKGKKAEVFSLFGEETEIFSGLGKAENLNTEVFRLAGFNIAKEANRLKLEDLYLDVPEFEDFSYYDEFQALVEGFLQSEAVTDRYKSEKSDKNKRSLKRVYLGVSKQRDKVEAWADEMSNVMAGVGTCRRLVNERSNTMTPKILADNAREILEPLGVEVEILDEKKLRELNAEAFLEVGRGSDEESFGIVMRWKGNKDSKDIVGLVGKGITYDSGGYSIKTQRGMVDMHTDMAGGASVIGAMEACARNNLKVNATGVVFACENLLSGHAYKTGDIIGSMKGKTIWVGSTDAEGRLTLADAVYYCATHEKATKIIDCATLTGAVIGALGMITTGVISNDSEFSDEFMKIGDFTGEAFHRLPLNDDYRDMIKHEEADLANTVGSKGTGAGTITAGAFIENFCEGLPWIHLDIAGTASGKARGYLPLGASGVPVKSFYFYLKSLE